MKVSCLKLMSFFKVHFYPQQRLDGHCSTFGSKTSFIEEMKFFTANDLFCSQQCYEAA